MLNLEYNYILYLIMEWKAGQVTIIGPITGEMVGYN